MEQAHEQVDGVLTAGQHAPDGRARVARVLRYLADEVEAGRAVADVDVNLDTGMRPKPRSWQEAGKPTEYERYTVGARWRVTATTLGEPPVDVVGDETAGRWKRAHGVSESTASNLALEQLYPVTAPHLQTIRDDNATPEKRRAAAEWLQEYGFDKHPLFMDAAAMMDALYPVG